MGRMMCGMKRRRKKKMGNINTRSTEKRKKRKYHEDRKEESKGLKNEQMRNTVWKKHLIKYCEKLGRNRNK
jgi:hypothetical protein